MVGVGARDDLASTIARVNADALQIESGGGSFELDRTANLATFLRTASLLVT